jgi:hypothetical protein
MGLDLGRIEAWTRETLEAEARRRRIRSPEFRTRGELIRLILRHQYGDRVNAGRDRIAAGRRTLAQARELVSMAVGIALSSLPEPLARVRARLPWPQAEPVSRPKPSAVEAAVPAVSNAASAPVAVAAVVSAPAITAAEPATAVVSAPAITAAEPATVNRTQPIATTRTFIEEPIRTRSMARLLAAQGHRERAVAIYEELLARDGEDVTLRSEVVAVRRGELVEAPVLPEPPAGREPLRLPDSGDRLLCQGEPSAGFSLRWHVTEAGLRRARAVLGGDGELAIRMIGIYPDPDRVVRSEVTEHGPVLPSGEWQTPALADAVRCFAAVGLRRAERFVAIVHAHPGANRSGGPVSVRPAVSA